MRVGQQDKAEPEGNNSTPISYRGRASWPSGRGPDSICPERAGEVINSKPIVVHCRTGARSALGASILQAAGAEEVINIQGGLRDWIAAGLPVENRTIA